MPIKKMIVITLIACFSPEIWAQDASINQDVNINPNVATYDTKTKLITIPELRVVGDNSGKSYAIELFNAEQGGYHIKSIVELASIWNSESQTLRIVRFNGYTEDPEQRYDEYVYHSEDIGPQALNKLKSIKTSRDNPLCWSDASYYQIVVTQQSGQEKEYYTNYNACNEHSFVRRTDVEELLHLLN